MKYTHIVVVAALALTTCANAVADEYTYITEVRLDGDEQSVALSVVKKVVFTETDVVIVTTAGDIVCPLTNFKNLTFADQPTDIKTLKDSSNSLNVTGNKLTVNGNGIVLIYSRSGQLVGAVKAEGSTALSLESLPQGIYIVTFGEESIKVTR